LIVSIGTTVDRLDSVDVDASSDLGGTKAGNLIASIALTANCGRGVLIFVLTDAVIDASSAPTSVDTASTTDLVRLTFFL
jgi:hypothetical protein